MLLHSPLQILQARVQSSSFFCMSNALFHNECCFRTCQIICMPLKYAVFSTTMVSIYLQLLSIPSHLVQEGSFDLTGQLFPIYDLPSMLPIIYTHVNQFQLVGESRWIVFSKQVFYCHNQIVRTLDIKKTHHILCFKGSL